MDLLAKIVLTVLGCGALVTLIGRLEFADFLYQATRGLPQPFADFFAFVVIIIILVALKKSES